MQKSENWDFKKISLTKAAKVCEDIELDDTAKGLLTADLSPAEFLQALVDNAAFADAARFLARALPPREATWWACVCARTCLDERSPQPVRDSLESAEKWVYKPSDENRRASFAAAQLTDFKNPASWAAMAAFWSGGSMAPPESPVVPPAANLTSKAVAGAVMLAAVMPDPVKAPERYGQLLQWGIDIACGGTGRPKEAS
jgi:hypothetical protein